MELHGSAPSGENMAPTTGSLPCEGPHLGGQDQTPLCQMEVLPLCEEETCLDRGLFGRKVRRASPRLLGARGQDPDRKDLGGNPSVREGHLRDS